jgi:hypothetical protein
MLHPQLLTLSAHKGAGIMGDSQQPVPVERIENTIFLIRGQKVMLDTDLSTLYGVTTSVPNKAVSSNLDRFSLDCMMQLTREEFSNMKCQFGTSNWCGTRTLPGFFISSPSARGRGLR